MAIYHLSAQIIGRSAGRSVTAAAAYRAHEKIMDERTGITHDYTRRRGDFESFIMAPDHAPDWVHDRAHLWNEVEKTEKRKDAQLARELNVALPIELTPDQQKDLLKEFVEINMVNRGMVADVAIHRDHEENPHAHILLTMRDISADGFGKKNREWNPDFGFGKVQNAEKYVDWREAWANLTNEHLSFYRHEARIDHRTLEAQGIDRLPTIHEGPAVRQMEAKGIPTERGEHNRMVQEHVQIVAESKQNVIDFEAFKRQKEQEKEQLQAEITRSENKPLQEWTREELGIEKVKLSSELDKLEEAQASYRKIQNIQREIESSHAIIEERQQYKQDFDNRGVFFKVKNYKSIKFLKSKANEIIGIHENKISDLQKELPPPREVKRLEEAAPKIEERLSLVKSWVESINNEVFKRDMDDLQQNRTRKQKQKHGQEHGRGLSR